MTYVYSAFGLLAVAAAALLAWLGDARGAVAAAVVAAAAFVFRGPGGRPSAASPRRGWVGFVALAGGMSLMIASLVPVLVLAALFVFKVVMNVRLMRALSRMTVDASASPETMPGADDALLREFMSAGFTPVASHRCTPLGRPITVTVLLDRRQDRVALVTDRVWQVASQFGRRWLVTTNSGLSPLPADVLRQEIPDGRPQELIDAHHAVLEQLESRGVHADRFENAAHAAHSAREMERHAISFLAHASLLTAVRLEVATRPADPRLDSGSAASHRVDAWLRSVASGQ